MRFISVVAAVGAAIGTTFDFGLAHGAAPMDDWVKLSAPSEGFSASFPAQPRVERSTHADKDGSYRTTRHIVVTDGMAMAVDYSRYVDPDTRIDLDQVMDNFAKAMNGKVTAQWDSSIRRSADERLPMLEYTVQSPQMICRAGAIADGAAVYQVIGCANKAAEMPQAIERMLSSFALTPRSQS